MTYKSPGIMGVLDLDGVVVVVVVVVCAVVDGSLDLFARSTSFFI